MTNDAIAKVLKDFLDSLDKKVYAGVMSDKLPHRGPIFNLTRADDESLGSINGSIDADGTLSCIIICSKRMIIDNLEYEFSDEASLKKSLQDAINAYDLMVTAISSDDKTDDVTLTEDDEDPDLDFGASDDDESSDDSDELSLDEEDSKSDDTDIDVVIGKLNKVKDFMNTAGDKIQDIMDDVAEDDVDTKIALIGIQSSAYDMAQDIGGTIEDITPEPEYDDDTVEESVSIGNRTRAKSANHIKQAYTFLGATLECINRSALSVAEKRAIKRQISELRANDIFMPTK